MNSQTYASIIMMLFFRNIDKKDVSSIGMLIRLTDSLADRLQIPLSLSDRTKHRTVKQLIKSNILIDTIIEGEHHISLNEVVRTAITERFTVMVR